MKKLTSFIAAASLVLAAGAFTVGTAATPPAAKDILMSFNETVAGTNTGGTLDGNVILTGAVSERGTRHEDFSVVSVNKDGSELVVAGTSLITTASGTISTKFTGTIYFDNATFNSTLLAYIEGTESITGGTGAYAGVVGKPGTFEATLDYTTGNVLGVFEAKVQLK